MTHRNNKIQNSQEKFELDTYATCQFESELRAVITRFPVFVVSHKSPGQREAVWVAAESGTLWSGALHTTHYYCNYQYFCIQWH